MTLPSFHAVASTTPEQSVDGYTRKDILYAAAVLAEKNRIFLSRKAQPVEVFEGVDHIANVWADAMEDLA